MLESTYMWADAFAVAPSHGGVAAIGGGPELVPCEAVNWCAPESGLWLAVSPELVAAPGEVETPELCAAERALTDMVLM